MSVDNPFIMVKQTFYQQQAMNPRLPLAVRIYSLAYGMCRRNGHAPFRQGDLAYALRTVDPGTGKIQDHSSSTISHTIRQVVEDGWLEPGSGLRCLVVPRYAVTGGVIGSEHERCYNHSGRWSP